MRGLNQKKFLNFFLLGLIVFFGVFVFKAGEAHAAGAVFRFFNWVAGNTFGEAIFWLLSAMASGILWVLGQLLSFMTLVISWLLSFTKFTTAPIVLIGWKIVRDFTNLFFAFGFIVIALATILHLEGYGYEKLLVKLIIAAIMINFSLVIVAPIIDFAQILSDFFIEETKKANGDAFLDAIAKQFQIGQGIIPSQQNYVCSGSWDCSTAAALSTQATRTQVTPDQIVQNVTSSCQKTAATTGASGTAEYQTAYSQCTTRTFNAINGCSCSDMQKLGTNEKDEPDQIIVFLSVVLSIFFVAMALFAFGAFAFFLVMRMIKLWIMLIFAPLVWLLGVFPITAGYIKNWWTDLIKWTFFSPAYLFFIYLSIEGTKNLILVLEPRQDINFEGAMASNILPTTFSDPSTFIQFIVMIGLLCGGLVAAQSIGATGAKTAVGLAAGLGKTLGNAATFGSINRFGRYQKAWQARNKEVEGGKQERITEKVGRWRAGVAEKTALTTKQKVRLEEDKRGRIGAKEKRYDSMNTNNLATLHNKPLAKLPVEDRAVIASVLAKRGELSKLKQEQIEKDLKNLDKLGMGQMKQNILQAAPELARLVKNPTQTDTKAIEEQIRNLTPDAIARLSSSSLTGAYGTVIKNAITKELKADGKLKSSHLSKIGDADPEVLDILRTEIKNAQAAGNLRPEINKYLTGGPGLSIFG